MGCADAGVVAGSSWVGHSGAVSGWLCHRDSCITVAGPLGCLRWSLSSPSILFWRSIASSPGVGVGSWPLGSLGFVPSSRWGWWQWVGLGGSLPYDPLTIPLCWGADVPLLHCQLHLSRGPATILWTYASVSLPRRNCQLPGCSGIRSFSAFGVVGQGPFLHTSVTNHFQ